MPFTDLVDAAKCVVKALFIREKYINRSMQTFCKTTAHALLDLGTKPLNLRVYDDIPETPVDAGIVCTHPVWHMLISLTEPCTFLCFVWVIAFIKKHSIAFVAWKVVMTESPL